MSHVDASAPAGEQLFGRRPSPLYSGTNVGTFYAIHLFGAVVPLAAGLIIYGWRAAAVVASVMASAAAAALVWRRIGHRGRQLRVSHCLWLALLLSLTLPAHLASDQTMVGGVRWVLWPLLPAAAITLVIFSWILGGMGSGRVHPVLATYLVIFVLFQPALVSHRVLPIRRLFRGDVMDAIAPSTDTSSGALALNSPALEPREPWYALTGATLPFYSEPADRRLIAYTSGRFANRGAASIEMLIRDQMPPLENLIIAGNAGAIGTSSIAAILLGGLLLLYRGLIDYKIPLLIALTAWASILILPIPVVIRETGAEWHWFAFRAPYLGWAMAVTFANYELFASPLLFVGFFLATAPAVRPMTRRGRIVFAAVVGVLSAATQLYASVQIGPYIALLIATLLTPLLDRILEPRPLL
jgi:Na+-translocating ferredoxin:NAD+ oxidoreductase RnfD subunit